MWDLPIINFDKFCTTGLIFNGVGCLFWVIAYAVLLKNIIKKKFVEMPAYVAGANIGWEFVWSFIYHPDSGWLYALSYMACFFMDVFIFISIIRYGSKQPMAEEFKKHFTAFALINFGFWILFTYFFISENYDTSIGANSGYIINVILSLQCLAMLFQVKDTANFSMVLAWTKMLGTGLISVSMFYFYPENHFVQLLGVSCLVIDNTYIYVLYKRHGKLFW